MSKESTFFVNGVLILAVVFMVGLLIGRECPKIKPIETVKTKTDTLFIYDTIVEIKPVFETRRVVERVLMPVVDTVRLRDTLLVYMDREQLVWRDSLSEIYASGIDPKIDSVRHFVKDRIVTIETVRPVVRKTRWGVGLQGGMGMGKDGLTPYVGVGLNYNLFSW